jgi:hypothetical protein
VKCVRASCCEALESLQHITEGNFQNVGVSSHRRHKVDRKWSFYGNGNFIWDLGWTIGVLGFDSWRGLGIFLFTAASRTALGPTQPLIQWVLGVLSLGIKWPGREADHSPPSSAEVKNGWSYTSIPQCAFMAWCLVKHRDNFTFTLIFQWNLNMKDNYMTYRDEIKCSHYPLKYWIKECITNVVLN